MCGYMQHRMQLYSLQVMQAIYKIYTPQESNARDIHQLVGACKKLRHDVFQLGVLNTKVHRVKLIFT